MTMGSRRSRLWPTITFVTLSICRLVEARRSPFSVTPSEKWYGDVGSWSAVSISVGKPEQGLDLMVSTKSSDITVVASTACSNTACSIKRGGTFNESQSHSWKSEGIESIGLDSVLGSDFNATFGSDTISYGDPNFSVENTRIGTFNSTEFPLGFLGLGVESGTSNGQAVSSSSSLSPISQLVETLGEISSHSYGYTAGASYRNIGGCPTSLTLGGKDINRYVDNQVSFELSSQQQPSVYINSMLLSLPMGTPIPLNWANESLRMVSPGQTVEAQIDSSTPYIWLPEQVCDSFASALNLTYNSTLDLYTFDGNVAQHSIIQTLNFSVSFELSKTASSIETVTIDLPYEAFDQEMTYPETKYYFPIKKATNESQYTLGRTFLQEAYIIVDYERGNFSLHQALFPSDAATNTSGVVEITRPADSTFNGPDDSPTRSGMSKATIVGIAVGSAALIALLIIANFYRIRYNRLKAAQNPQGAEKPISKTDLLLAKLHIGRRHLKKPSGGRIVRNATVHETEGNSTYAVEAGTNAHERFELAAPLEPVELDSETIGSYSGTDTQVSQLSEYERERLRMQIALQRATIVTSFPEKRDINTHEEGTYRSENSAVSAISPGNTSPSSVSHLLSPLRDPPPSYQRHAHPIIPDGTEIICAGPMPYISPGMEVGFLPDRRADMVGLRLPSPRIGGGDRSTLGSNYTVEESRTLERLREIEGEREYEAMMNPGGLGRSMVGQDLVHVPQVAARRFSWESGA